MGQDTSIQAIKLTNMLQLLNVSIKGIMKYFFLSHVTGLYDNLPKFMAN